MKKKNLIQKTLVSALVLSLGLSSGLMISHLHKDHTQSNTNSIKQSARKTSDSFYVRENWGGFQRTYDQNALRGNQIKIVGNGDVSENSTYVENGNNIAAIFKKSSNRNGYIFTTGGGHAINNNGNGFDPWDASIQYIRDDYSHSDIKEKDWIAKGEMTTGHANRLHYTSTSKHGHLGNDNKVFGGVVQVSLPYYRTDTWHGLDFKDVFKLMIGFNNNGRWTSLYNSNHSGINKNVEFDNLTNRGTDKNWNSTRVQFGMYDDVVYFETKQRHASSSTSINKRTDFKRIHINDFKTEFNSTSSVSSFVSKYFSFVLNNTPNAVIYNGSTDSTVSINFDDRNEKVIVSSRFPRRMTTSQKSYAYDSASHRGWIKNDAQVAELSIPYSEFMSPTVVKGGDIGLSDIWINNATDTQIIQQMIDKGLIKNTIDAKVNAQDIEIQKVKQKNAEGTMVVNVKIKNNKGVTISQPRVNLSFSNITLTGFKAVPTYTMGKPIVTLSDVEASLDAYNAHQSDIKNAIIEAVVGKTYKPSDIYLQGFVSADPYTGTISINASIDNWKDEKNPNGALKTFNGLTIHGFKEQLKPFWHNSSQAAVTITLSVIIPACALLVMFVILTIMYRANRSKFTKFEYEL